MPKLLTTRLPEDTEEERKIRKLARSRHAPGDWIFRARITSLSWRGMGTSEIAHKIGCHPKTVRKRRHRFNAEGMELERRMSPKRLQPISDILQKGCSVQKVC